MRIIELTSENVKRLKAVNIKPDPHVQVIGGRNAQGKSSVMDAIWLAIAGGSASKATQRPIRDGEDNASVRLDLGDMIVTRTWSGDRTALKVESKDGLKYPSPQSVLDALVGRFSFDPLMFTRLSAKEQRDALMELVELPFDPQEIALQRATLYDQRTEIGRTRDSLEGQAGAAQWTEGLPDEPVSVSELVGKLQSARENNAASERRQELLWSAQHEVDSLRESLALREAELEELKKVPVGKLIDLTELESRISGAEETNEAIRRNAESKRLKQELKQAREDYAQKTQQIDTLDQTKAEGLAKAKFPVEGLAFDDEGVTYNGVPFSQASSAEQIRVSLAMAMALNPKLRVLRIMDGSLLDGDNLAMIEQMAHENDYQVWIEVVDPKGRPSIIIEDGAIAVEEK